MSHAQDNIVRWLLPLQSSIHPCVPAGKYDQLTYHGLTSRGSQPITFIPAAGATAVTLDAPEQYLNITFNNFNVPTNYTSYMCKASLLCVAF